MARQDLRRRRALESDERAAVETIEFHVGGKMALDPVVVHGLARSVDHDVQGPALPRRGRPADHEVIDDAAVGVGELGIAHAPGSEPEDIAGNQLLESGGGRQMIGTDQTGLAHMGNVEEPCRLARVEMFTKDALVLQRHFIAGERGHAGAK